MRRMVFGVAAAALLAGSAAAQTVAAPTIASPDGKVTVATALTPDGTLTYRIDYAGRTVIAPSSVGLTLATDRPDKPDLGRLMSGLSILSVDRRQGRDRYAPLSGKTSSVDDPYTEVTVHARETAGMRRRIDLVLRAYDSGAAFRLVLPQQASFARARITEEDTRFVFPTDYHCLGLNLGKYENSHEGEFDPIDARLIRPHDLYDAPLVCPTAPNGPTFALTESDLENYAGAYFSGIGDGTLGVAINLSPHPDDAMIAVDAPVPAAGLRTPWRVVMLADRPEKLIDSNLVDDLAQPSRLTDTGWIRPGKYTWDWWSGPMVPNPGFDDATYERFIDLAARLGLPYTVIDEGWAHGAGGGGYVRPDSDITRSASTVHLPALIAYAKARNVGLWLWVNWKALDRQMDAALALYERLGIKGIKVDFMDREDQAMVDYYHRLLTKAAAHHLMVDLHGAYVPRGLERTYPNFVTQEGVMGAEYNKWSTRETATHNVSLAYTRGLLGTMDYTPGGFHNTTPADFRIANTGPDVMTTRAQQLAMYVVYLSPFGCVADAPGAYLDPSGRPVPGVDFLEQAPTSWDETRAIAGDFGHYVAVARRKGNRWYVGVLNDETARTVTLPLDFLGGGNWQMERWTDGSKPTDLVTGSGPMRGGKVTVQLASGGGAALLLTPR